MLRNITTVLAFLILTCCCIISSAGTPPCEIQRVDASTGGGTKHQDMEYGSSTAMSDDGDYFVVGAASEDYDVDNDPPTEESVGAVYVYLKSGSTWSRQARLVAPDGDSWDHFGASVDISGDGDYIVVGAHHKGKSTISEGRAYVFTRSGTTWSYQATLSGSGAVYGALFGCSVAIDTDGETVLVGAKYDGTTDEEDDPLWKRGEVYVFTRSGTSWSQQANLYADDWDEADDGIIFGASVDICGDIAVIGSREADCQNDDEGAVYVFSRDGTSWEQDHKFYASDGAYQDWFGFDVAVDGDADTIVVGARYDDDEGTDAGSAYVFVYSGNSWSQQDKVTDTSCAGGDHFGRSVAISADGLSILVGANLTDTIMVGYDIGTAYYFTPSGTDWSLDFIIEADDRASDDWFGWDVCMSADGEYRVITASKDDVDVTADAGSAYVVGLTSSACP